MEKSLLKVRVAVLWIFLAVGMSASMILALMGPGFIEEVMSGEMEGMKISAGLTIFFSLFWLIPLIMAFLSVTLKDGANRITNLILGILFLVFYIIHLIGHIVQGNLPVDHLVMCLFTIVVPALIVWYSWKWPRGEEPSGSA
jgi:hypothetical protein